MSPQLRGWIGAAHPFPLAAVLALTTLIAFASAEGRPDTVSLALVLLAMLFSQLAIGWSNDYVDREADAQYQPSKPVPAGLVRAEHLPPAIGVALVLSLLSGLLLGALPLLLLIGGTACGLVYNFRLKATRLSPLPYVAALALLPAFVWTSLDVYRDEFLSLYLIATPLPIAAHLANVLPDIETDRAQGRRTAAVLLGKGASVCVIAACLLLPLGVLDLSFIWLDYRQIAMLLTVTGYAALCFVALPAYLLRRRLAEVWAFRLIVVACVLFAGGWLAAVT